MIMTLEQIREIKANYQGLELNTSVTGMFSNKSWASLWKIKFIQPQEMKNLIKYLDDNDLIYFFGSAGIHIQ